MSEINEEIAKLLERVDEVLREAAAIPERTYDVAEAVAILDRIGELLTEFRRSEMAIEEEAPITRRASLM